MASKNSKKGCLKLLKHPAFEIPTGGSHYMTVPIGFDVPGAKDVMRTVFHNGEVTVVDTLPEIRERAEV